jgi:hypothetical protein
MRSSPEGQMGVIWEASLTRAFTRPVFAVRQPPLRRTGMNRARRVAITLSASTILILGGITVAAPAQAQGDLVSGAANGVAQGASAAAAGAAQAAGGAGQTVTSVGQTVGGVASAIGQAASGIG